MMNFFQQLEPHCDHQHYYDPDFGKLLHKLQHDAYKNAEDIIHKLLIISKENKVINKEILAYHIKGNAEIHRKKYSNAIKSFEYAISLARESKNHLAIAQIGFDLIRVCNIKHMYDVIFYTFNEIIQSYQYLDLIDEKIHCLIQLSHYHRIFGNNDQAFRSLNLAKNLHDTLEDSSSHNHSCIHDLYFKITHAHLAKKSHNYSKSSDIAKNILKKLKDHCTSEICQSNSDFLQIESLFLIAEACLEKKNREKSIATLDKLRKLAKKNKNTIIEYQYNLIRIEHELFFENDHFDDKNFLILIKEIYNHGGVEFALEQILRLLNKFYSDNTLDQHELLLDTFEGLIHKITKNMPDTLANHFLNCYEFKSARSLKSSTEYQMKKFIEIGNDLLCEHNLNELAHKILHFILNLSKMERGFVKLFDSKFSEDVMATHHFDKNQFDAKKSDLTACLDLAHNVFEKDQPLVLTNQVTQDFFNLNEKHYNTIKKIERPSIIVLPIRVNATNIGIVYADSKIKNVLQTEDDVELIESLMALIANIIHNASHLEGNQDQKRKAQVCRHHKNKSHEINKYSLENFIGLSDESHNLLDLIKHTLDSTATITLTGHSGVGKEMIAKMIHYNGSRKNNSFVTLNCAAIPETLFESELFGHVKGAFTDARDNKPGLFSKAHDGTIFLDEIGEMPLSMQVKLLRVLQEREVVPIGGRTPQKIDVRIICATNRDLEMMVKTGAFREDLFYRISVVNIHVPSLQKRKEDIPLFVNYALKLYAEENNTSQKTVSNQAMNYLMSYSWPGNIRELINIIYNLSIFVNKPCIELSDLEERKELFRMPVNLADSNTTMNEASEITKQLDSHQLSLSEAKQEFEKMQIERALKLYNGQITSASYHLQMPRPQVSRLMKKYKINKNEYK